VRSPLRAAHLWLFLSLILVGVVGSGCGDAAWTLIIASGGGLEDSGLVVFIHIENGESSGYRQDDETFFGEVIRDAATWRSVWSAHRPSSPPPPVDFVRDQVLAVFMGQQSLGCDEAGVAVESVTRQGEELEVVIEERHPDGGAGCRSNPYDFVRCARTAGPVSFVRR